MTDAATPASPAAHPYASWGFRAPALACYGASMLALLAGADAGQLRWSSYGLAAAAGVAIVVATRRYNAWVLFTVGFVQPLIVLIPAAVAIPSIVLSTFSLRPPLEVGAVCALGGLGASLPLNRTVRPGDFSVHDWIAWLAPWRDALDRAESLQRILASLLAVGTLLAGIVSLLR